MKKKVIMLMMGVMIFSLCACENQNADTANTAGSNIEKNISKQDTSELDKGEQGISEEKVVSETEKESTMELKNVLDEINTDIQPETTGNYMTSIRVASHLLNWGVGTSMGTEEIKREVVEWMSEKGNDEQVNFSRKLSSVYEAYQQLLGSDAEELLVSAGCDDTGYPWSDSPVETIETIIDVVQLPEDSAEPLDTESTDTQSTTSDINNSDNANSLANNSEIADDTQTDTYPGPDVAEIVNLKGDETTVYKLVDGRYMNRVNAIFIFDGVDTWTDENGVEWNEIVK